MVPERGVGPNGPAIALGIVCVLVRLLQVVVLSQWGQQRLRPKELVGRCCGVEVGVGWVGWELRWCQVDHRLVPFGHQLAVLVVSWVEVGGVVPVGAV